MVERRGAPVRPRHDPSAQNALVLPRPRPQTSTGAAASATIVDVVVDPHLSKHLRPHQREGVGFLYECVMNMRNYSGTGAVLADEMGLGKTLQCIALVWTLLKQGPWEGRPTVRRALVVCPSSLVKNWSREFDKWLGQERIRTYRADKDKTLVGWAQGSARHCPVAIISYEQLLRQSAKATSLPIDLIICDEGHRLKNTSSKIVRALMQLPCRRRVILTGTPVQNNLQEFYAIMEFVNPGVLGSQQTFRSVYEKAILRSREPGATPADVDLGQSRGAELARLVALFCLRRTAEVNRKYLPPKSDYVVFCQPTEAQLRAYQALIGSRVLKRCFTSSGGGGGSSDSPHLRCVDALKKLCNSLALMEEPVSTAAARRDAETLYHSLVPLRPEGGWVPGLADSSGKLLVLVEMLRAMRVDPSQERVVIVSNSTKCLREIALLCEAEDFPYQLLQGSTPPKKRLEMVTRFNKNHGQQFIFLLSSKAGGTGLNIVGASRLILFDSDWNPANDEQAMARVWRPGQTRHVGIYRLLTTGTIEEKIYQRQITKQGLSDAIEDVRGAARKTQKNGFTKEELRDIFSLRQDTGCDTHDLLGCDCGVGTGTIASGIGDKGRRSRGAPRAKRRKMEMGTLLGWQHLFP
eukprot:UC1_evm1s2183